MSEMSKIGRSQSAARKLVEVWATTLYQESEWEYKSRRRDAIDVLEALCLPDADDVFTTLPGERTRRQVAAEQARRKAEKAGEGEQ